jgi:hypothetical protein
MKKGASKLKAAAPAHTLAPGSSIVLFFDDAPETGSDHKELQSVLSVRFAAKHPLAGVRLNNLRTLSGHTLEGPLLNGVELAFLRGRQTVVVDGHSVEIVPLLETRAGGKPTVDSSSAAMAPSRRGKKAGLVEANKTDATEVVEGLSSEEKTGLLAALLTHATDAEFSRACAALAKEALTTRKRVLDREEGYARWEKQLKGLSLRGLNVDAAKKRINQWIEEKSLSAEFETASDSRRDNLAKCFRDIKKVLGCQILHGEGKSQKKVNVRTYPVQDGTGRRRFIVEQSEGKRTSLQTCYGVPAIFFE